MVQSGFKKDISKKNLRGEKKMKKTVFLLVLAALLLVACGQQKTLVPVYPDKVIQSQLSQRGQTDSNGLPYLGKFEAQMKVGLDNQSGVWQADAKDNCVWVGENTQRIILYFHSGYGWELVSVRGNTDTWCLIKK